jgi:predicted nucleic acid-binding protein
VYDTGILIGYLRGQRKWKKPVEDARNGLIEVFISSITLLELHVGAHLSDNYEASYQDILTIQSWFQIISIDEKVAEIGAAIIVDLRKKN